jgi:ferrous iron transport protein A
MAGEMGYRYGVDNDFQNSRKALVMMNLWELGAQNDACVLHFSPTTPTNYRERLSELGFVVGASIQCLRITPFGGPRIYKVGGCIYSLDRELAQMIHIGPETEEIR